MPPLSPAVRHVTMILLVAVAARLVAAVFLGGGFHFPDEIAYADAAKRLLRGEGFGVAYQRVPGYPVLLALLGVAGPESVLWLRLAQGAATGLAGVVAFLLADRLVGRDAALASAAIYALDPLLVTAGALLYPEAPAAVFLAAAVLFAWRAAERGSPSDAVAAGLGLSVAALFRPVALVLVPVVMAWLLGFPGPQLARRVGFAALVGMSCLLVLAPWTYRNYLIHGRFVPISLAGTGGGSVRADRIETHGLTGAVVDELTTEPGRLVSRMAREFGHFWELVPARLATDNAAKRELLHRRDSRLPLEPSFSRGLRDVVGAATFAAELLLALGGAVVLWRTRRREATLLLAVVLAYAVGHSLIVGRMRYRITVLPLVFVLAGAGAAALAAVLRDRWLRRRRSSASPSRA